MPDDSVQDHKFDHAAAKLSEVRMSAGPIDDLPSDLQPESLEESYLIQDRLNAILVPIFGPPVGYKIGCTTRVMQEYLGISHPCAGRIFQSMTRHLESTFKRRGLCRPGVECEIAVQVGRDTKAGRNYTAKDCDDFVDCAMASIELVDDRWTDFSRVSAPTLISDNFFNAGCVFGERSKIPGDELGDATGTMWINGEVVGTGSGADILGHPYEALAWLANHQSRRGNYLQAGDIVSLGSVVQTQWIDAGDTVVVDFPRLGQCSLRLE